MRAATRQWIYSGLAVPRGVVLVRRPAARPGLPQRPRIALYGGEVADRLQVPLGELARGASGRLVVRAEPRWSTAEWAADPELWRELVAFRPAAVLFALGRADRGATAALTARANGVGAAVRWLPPPGERVVGPGIVPAPLVLVSPRAQLSVGTFAAWAGAAWQSLAGVSPRRQ